mmetsp:Transcript_16022/g.28899  ORF Transcript_16022/g.28899 Transcript_16022/m.28899 type:complete len:337 (+) Transcript_16022:67-1077(+)
MVPSTTRTFLTGVLSVCNCKLSSGFLHHHSPPTLRPLLHKAMMATSMPTDGCPLPFEIGPYSAAEVTVGPSPGTGVGDGVDDGEFLSKLDQSIDFWRENDYTSAWVTIPASRARLIERLSSNEDKGNFGFDLHHINSTQQTIILKRWLKDGTEDKIPPWASHQVGCAGFVLNDQNEILLIKEWSGPLSSRVPSRQWKMPGGLLDAGESFEEATCREVMEETGVPCEFESILTFWHRHGLKWDKSDLYYVCLLRPKSLELEICPVEVSAAKWMHVDDFLATEDHPLITHVLKTNFLLDGSIQVGSSERLTPIADMAAGAIQWPNREPYPTYSSIPRK